MFRFHVVSGIFWRNVKSYFSGVLGYLIIVAFVTLCALLAFSQTFFANNFASLDELSKVYGWLLLFLVPAISMGAWAEEHRSGTDVLLFTLPATTWEILLGKYLAVCAVYTIALLFSVTQVLALALLGQPDWSVILSTYYGFWLAGLALLSIGLFASSLTRDSAVAFVLGMVLCSIPVLGGYFLQGSRELDSLSVQSHIDQFSSGLITLPSLFYFAGVILLFLYLNHVVISQRLWVRLGKEFMLLNYLTRGVSLVAVLIAGYFLLDRLSGNFPTYLDLTSENLYTLDQTTIKAIDKAAEQGTKVTIESYISQEVPADFVPVKKQLQTLLAQYDRLGGGNVSLREVAVTPTSDAATAAEAAGIEPTMSRTMVGGKNVEQNVYLGVVVKTENGDAVLPMFDARDSIEYEITRAIASQSGADNQLTLGVMETDLHLAGLQYQGQTLDLSFGQARRELEKFYRLRRVDAGLLQDYVDALKAKSTAAELEGWGVTATAPLSEERKASIKDVKLPNVLLVAGASSLDQNALDLLVDYIKFGQAVLILDDPVPFMWPTYISGGQFGICRSPAQERISPQAPFSVLNASPAPKASTIPLQQALGIDWKPARIAWHALAEPESFAFPIVSLPMANAAAWPEGYGSKQNALVFFRNSGESQAFNTQTPVSSSLRELLLIYCGTIEKAVNSSFDFQPLVSTVASSDSAAGTLDYDQYSETRVSTRPEWDASQNRQVLRKSEQTNPYTGLPERVLKSTTGLSPQENLAQVVAAQIKGTPTQPRNVIVIADTDFISDLAFECEKSMKSGLDNLQFLQNAIESLGEDDSFIDLRGRRSQLRPLVRIDDVRREARGERLRQAAELENALQSKLSEAQAKLDEKTQELQENKDLNFMQRLQLSATAASEEQNRFDREMEKAEKEFKKKVSELEVAEKKTIESQENWTRLFAVLLPPLPALAIGIGVILVRLSRQAAARR